MSDTTLHPCSVRWSGNTQNYDSFPRLHELTFPGGQKLRNTRSSDAAASGAADPEQILSAAASSCIMLTFLAVAAKSKVNVVGYEDDAEAVMEFVDRRTRVTRILLRPRIRIEGAVDQERLKTLMEKAHANCTISLSIKSEVIIEPTFVSA